MQGCRTLADTVRHQEVGAAQQTDGIRGPRQQAIGRLVLMRQAFPGSLPNVMIPA